MAVVSVPVIIGGLVKAAKFGVVTTGLFKVGKGLLNVGKGLKSVGKGLSQGLKSSPKSTTITQGVKSKISAPAQQDTSQTISPSYYEDPKRQSIFKRTASDGSIKSVKITVTNIKSVLFKQQEQLAKHSKDNANLEQRLSDLAKKKQTGQKLNKQLSTAISPLLAVVSGVNNAIPLLMASIIGNMGFELAKNAGKIGENLTTSETDKAVNDSVKKVGKEETLDLLNQEQEEKKKKGNRFSRWFKRVIWGEGAEYKEQQEKLKSGQKTPIHGFFGQIKSKEKLKNLNDTTLIDNDNEVTNTIIINKPIEVPANQ